MKEEPNKNLVPQSAICVPYLLEDRVNQTGSTHMTIHLDGRVSFGGSQNVPFIWIIGVRSMLQMLEKQSILLESLFRHWSVKEF